MRTRVPPVELALWMLMSVGCALPVLVTHDLPLIDLPTHLASLEIWRHYDDPARDFHHWYAIHLKLVPYWGYYGIVHALNWIMPLRAANKVFVVGSIIGAALGLRALLVAHERPPILALAGLVLGWNFMVGYGFLAFYGGVGPLLWSYAQLARLADERPWPSRNTLLRCVCGGIVLYLFHPLLVLLWLPAVLLYVRDRRALVGLPVLLLFAWGFSQEHHESGLVIAIAGEWLHLKMNFSRAWKQYILGGFAPAELRKALMLSLFGVVLLAAALIRPKEGTRDRRPLALAALLVAMFLALPLHLQKPVGMAEMNVRVPIVFALALFACVPQGTLTGWRAVAVVAPILVAGLIYDAVLTTRFAAFDRKDRDFYTLVDKLPMAPKVLTLVYEPYEPLFEGYFLWQKFPSYVQIERGGWNNTLWTETQGIGETGFPVEKLPAREPNAPDPARPRDFDWAKQGPSFDWFLTKDEPRGSVFTTRPELELAGTSGAWHLWHRVH